MGEWQPIETAPKDGTRILVCSAQPSDDPAFWDHQVVKWVEAGWYDGEWIYEADDFTHWMPLPEPPKT